MEPAVSAVHEIAPLISPRALAIEMPPASESIETIGRTRREIRRILTGQDNRLLVIVGPCSIHDPAAALEYAARLAKLSRELRERICIIMRVYFEKPRTSVGWKGLISDPDMNGSCDMGTGLRLARQLLIDITAMGLGAGMELLDPIISHYIGDLASWAAIGARTAESQIHRQMASGLAMPVGFKNSTEGSMVSAVDAIEAARAPSRFLSVDRHGRVCVASTAGNPHAHMILRGGLRGPNYWKASVNEARILLRKRNLSESILVDCSHMNSGKSHERQLLVWENIVARRAGGEQGIAGIMVESNLQAGRQLVRSCKENLGYGVSVTDECIGWDETEAMLRETYRTLDKM